MKLCFAFIAVLCQILAVAQPDEWDGETIKRNKVKGVAIVVERPNTRLDHPPRILQEFSFDEAGRVTNRRCKDCLIRFHVEPPSADHRIDFTYVNGKLVRMDEVGFEKTATELHYDSVKNRVLKTTTDDKSERTSIALEYLDRNGRKILSWQIDFESAYEYDDGIGQVFFDKTEWTHTSTGTFRQTYLTEELVNTGSVINKTSFTVFQTSLNLDEIENTLKEIDLTFLKPRKPMQTEKNRIRIFEHMAGSDKGKSFYFDKNGLIVKEVRDIEKGQLTFLYQYVY
jgi:hypothetical protein